MRTSAARGSPRGSRPGGRWPGGSVRWRLAILCCLVVARDSASGGDLMGGPVRLSVMRGHDGAVNGVACIDVRGRATAVSAGEDGTLRRWNLTTGEPDGTPVAVPGDGVTAVACTVLDGRPVAVTGAEDGTVRTWDLVTGSAAG